MNGEEGEELDGGVMMCSPEDDVNDEDGAPEETEACVRNKERSVYGSCDSAVPSASHDVPWILTKCASVYARGSVKVKLRTLLHRARTCPRRRS